MIQKKPLLMAGSLSLAAFIAVAMVATPAFAGLIPAYATVTGGSVVLTNSNHNERLLFNVTTGGDIPKRADQFIQENKLFGYAWLGNPFPPSGNTSTPFVAATIHTGILDSIQNPTGWHVHSGTLSPNAACTTNTGLAVSTLTDPTGAGVNIQGSALTASIAQHQVVVSDSNFSGHVAAFTLVPSGPNNSVLCVQAFSAS